MPPGPDDNLSLRFQRKELVNIINNSGWTAASQARADDVSETDWSAPEAWVENASGNELITGWLDQRGVNAQDWHAARRELDPQRMAGSLLGEVGLPLPTPGLQDGAARHAMAEVARWGRNWETQTLSTFDDRWTPAAVRDSLQAFHGAANLSNPLQGGLRFEGHLETYLHVIEAARSSLDAGFFVNEHPAMANSLIAAHERLQGSGLGVRLQGNAPTEQGYGARGYVALFQDQGMHQTSAIGVTDHFKFLGANLGTADAVLAIGSANATMAALGRLNNRREGRPSSRGGNLESTFVLQAGMFKDDAVFLSLSRQAARAAEWVTSRGLDPVHAGQAAILGDPKATRAELAGRLRADLGRQGAAYDLFVGPEGAVGESRILSGQGIAQKHIELLRSEGLRSATLISYNVGGQFLEEVRGALDNGAHITLLTGARWDLTLGPVLTAETRVASELAKFQASLTPEQAARFDLVQNQSELVHAKVSTFEMADAVRYSIYDTANRDDEHFLGTSFGRQDSGPIRNLGQFLSSRDYDGLVDEHTRTRQIVNQARLMTGRLAGARSFAVADLDALVATFRQYGLNASQARVQMAPGTDNINSIRFRVGGVFGILDETGRTQRIDLGEIKTLTALSHVNGFDGQFYVPELVKFVGGVKGIGVVDPKTGKRSDAREVEALEVLAAGTAAANAQVHALLNSLARRVGAAGVQQLMADPTRRGYLRAEMGRSVRRTFENFAGVEPGTPVYDAKAYARLGFGVDSRGLLNMRDSAALGAPEMDAVLSGLRPDVDLGTRDFMFAAGGLSRHRADGTRTPIRFYDLDMVQTLGVGLQRRGRGENQYMFLLPLSKLAQLPQRLQNIMSARALGLQDDPTLLDSLGANPNEVENLRSTSRFIGEDGKTIRGFRVRGFSIAGMPGDNAYMVGERFEHAFFGNETWSQTAKLRKGDAVVGAPGRLFVDEIRSLARDGWAHALGDDKFFLPHELLEKLDHRIGVSLEHQEGTAQLLQEDLMLGTDKLHRTGLVIDLKTDRGVSLVDDGNGSYTFTVRGTTVRQLQSGDRAMIGGKFPFAFIEERSRALQAVRAYTRGLDPTTYKLLGFENDLGQDLSNAMFGSKTLKTGQALVETGIEVLSSGAWQHQLDALENVDALKDLAGTLDRLAMFAPDGPGVQREFRKLANSLRGRDHTATRRLLETRLQRSGAYLAMHPDRAISMAGDLDHVGAAILAFGLHARYSLQQAQGALDSADFATRQQARDFYMAFNPEYTAGAASARALDPSLQEAALDALWNRVGERNMPSQMLLGSTLMSFTTMASATAVTMSSRNRVNFLDYHAGGYTDAFMNLMASSPELLERNEAYQELVYGGLLGHGGRGDVRFGWEFNPMTRFVAGTTVEFEGQEVNPYAEVLKMQQQVRGIFGGERPTSLAELRSLQAERARYEGLNPLLEAALKDPNRAPLRSGGSTTSTGVQAHLAVLEAGKVGARALQIPRIGWLQADGSLRVDANASGARAGMDLMSVNLLSAAALRSLGSFEDFSPEIQRLQVQIEQLSGVLAHIGDENGVLVNHMTGRQQEQYRELLFAVGALISTQKEAAATGLQKLMGGQLALPGRNMVIGTLPEVPTGTMVLGAATWKIMRDGAAEETMLGMSASGRGLVRGFRELATQVGAAPELLARLDAGLEALDGGEAGKAIRGQIEALKAQKALVLDAFDTQFDHLSLETGRAVAKIEAHHAAWLARETTALTDGYTGRLQQAQATLRSDRSAIASRLADATANLGFERQNALKTRLEAVNARFSAEMELVEAAWEAAKGFNREVSGHLRALEVDGARTHRALQLRNLLGGRLAERISDADRVSLVGEASGSAIRRVKGTSAEFQRLEALAERARTVYQQRRARRRTAGVQRGMLQEGRNDALELLDRLTTLENSRVATLGAVQERVDAHFNTLLAPLEGQAATERVQAYAKFSLERRSAGALADEALKQARGTIAESRRSSRTVVFQLHGIEKRRLIASQQADLVPLQAQLDDLFAQQKALRDPTGVNDLVRGLVEELFEDAAVRDQLMRSVFQRAGAPFGPEGLVVGRIMTDSEYNRRDPALRIFGRLSQTSVFMNVNDMAYNLGDFDGDTGSVTWLKEYSFLQAKDRLYRASKGEGVPLTALERGRLRHADEKLALSSEETLVALGRHYTGWNDLFSDRALYIGSDTTLKDRFGGDVVRTRVHLQALTKAEARGATLTTAQQETLQRFQARKENLAGLAIAGNEYVAEMHKAHDEVRSFMADRAGPGSDRNQLFRDFFRTSAADRALVHFEKMQEVVAKANTRAESEGLPLQNLTHTQLVTFFAMTSYAATTIIGSTFEAAYALQSEASRARAHGLFAIHARAEALLAGHGGLPDLAEAPERLRAVTGADARQAGVLLAEYETFNERHARLSGQYLVLQQMAREAIKPKSGTDQLDEIRQDLKSHPSSRWGRQTDRAAVSGMRMANKQVRAIALDWFHATVTGQGMLVDPTDPTSRQRLRSIDADGTILDNGVRRSWRDVYTEVAAGLYDYHKTGVDGLYARGVLDAEKLGTLFGGHDLPTGLEAFGHVGEATARAQGLLDAEAGSLPLAERAARTAAERAQAQVAAGKVSGKHALGTAFQKALIDQYVEDRAYASAAQLLEEGRAGRRGREMKTAYMQALYGTNPAAFSYQSARMSVGDKLFVLGQVVARGKFDSSSAGDMERAMLDVFGHYEIDDVKAEARRLHQDTLRDTGNKHFARHMATIFERWAEGSNMAQAIEAGHRRSRMAFEAEAFEQDYAGTMRGALESSGLAGDRDLSTLSVFELARTINAHEKATGRDNLGLAEDTAEGQKLLRARAHTEAAEFHDTQARTFAGGPRPGSAVTAQDTSAVPNPHAASTSATADRVVGRFARSEAAAGTLGGLAVMGAAFFGTADPAQAAEASGEAVASLVAFADPRMLAHEMVRSSQHLDRGDRAALGLVTVASLGAGALAGHQAYAWGVRHAAATFEGAGHEAGEHVTARAGLFGMALSALAGVAAATVTGTLATAIAQRFGHLRDLNPIPEAVAQLTEFTGLGTNESSGTSDFDELAELGDQPSVDGIVEIRDANGDVVAQEFYTFTAAALDEDGGLDTAGMLESELDTHITQADFDNEGNRGVGDSLATGNNLNANYLQ